jgi:adenylylsulfate kinase
MSQTKSTHIVWHSHTVSREEREKMAGHKGCTIWLTGLSASGKSTIANLLDAALAQQGMRSFILDGDNVRHGLNKDLGFSPADRTENIRRIGEVAKLFTEAGVIVATAFISPYRADRDQVRKIMKEGDFLEVFVDAPLDVCEQRDPKGLYKKARAGEVKEFTGISAPYEAPDKPELVLRTAGRTAEDCTEELYDFLVARGYVPPRR